MRTAIGDPRQLLAANPMRVLQVAIIAVTVALTALDGFDVLAISFASPGIAHEWGIDRAALGFVLSMELVGMGIGSVLLGGVADGLGRRRTILGCLLVMTLGMFMVSRVHNLTELSLWRVFTGVGIGGMLAATNAVAAEFANYRRRDLCVALMAIGYPLGAVIGGVIAAHLLKRSDWRAVFEFGGAVTAAFFPIVYWLVPESVPWACQRQPRNALSLVNGTLKRLGYAPVAALPPLSHRGGRAPLLDILRPGLALATVLVTATYFLHITTFYFIIKWVPKIVVDMGFTASAAAGVLVWTNVGGACGGAVLGMLAQRFSVKPVTVVLLIASTLAVAVFGRGQSDLQGLSRICAVAGFCTNGAVVGIYAVLARTFPAALRATGTGFAIGVGRGGAMIAPIIAGLLFHAGFSLQYVALAMGAGSLVAALCLALLPLRANGGHLDEAAHL
jgi:benzoate transport